MTSLKSKGIGELMRVLLIAVLLGSCGKSIGEERPVRETRIVRCIYQNTVEEYKDQVIDVSVSQSGTTIHFKDGSSVRYAPSVPCRYTYRKG